MIKPIYHYLSVTLRKTQFVILCIAVLPLNAMAINLPRAEPVPGGIAIVPLDVKSSSAPVVKYNGKRVLTTANPEASSNPEPRWLAVTGIPLGAKPGMHSLTVKIGNKTSTVKFEVKNKAYETQHITIKDKRKVNPYKKDLKRIGEEKKLIVASLRHWSDTPSLSEGFLLPVKGRLSSPFGLRRYFNEQPRKPHSGIDIAAPEGTPIVSPTSGSVLRTGDYFFNGKTVFIDHGQGLVSMYCHMSRIDVKPGQKVAAGETIGAIGMTGRVTGPHLHWGVSLNDARVDPALFYDDINKLLTTTKDNK